MIRFGVRKQRRQALLQSHSQSFKSVVCASRYLVGRLGRRFILPANCIYWARRGPVEGVTKSCLNFLKVLTYLKICLYVGDARGWVEKEIFFVRFNFFLQKSTKILIGNGYKYYSVSSLLSLGSGCSSRKCDGDTYEPCTRLLFACSLSQLLCFTLLL